MEENTEELRLKLDQNTFSKQIKSMLVLSVLILLTFLIANLLNFKQYTLILIGAGSREALDVFRGLIYVISYLGIVVFVPILLLGSAILKLISIKLS